MPEQSNNNDEENNSDYDFELSLAVRDYECDLQGVVNNATYQNYLEHARHKYLQNRNLSFAHFHETGHDLVLTRAEIDYKAPLKSGDSFTVKLRLEKESRLRFRFIQDIYKEPDDQHILHGRLIGTCLNRNGRPGFPLELEALIATP
ncbi:MAG: acyl-CoA thioesterase [Candidatus Latescibacteria bacterium]|jgi:acyl-CoA thioester hydrolase|nr:acyl-CoA thioesterase [Candidatus Latescibacterota bacterium]|tara:strand:+ start:149 stop:589 length:441 start_codon:yes stop_codon:yes gene_type:complete